jgi:sterol desaturase/sphingolipid hydroxylase (fatty acid hydroxylase superfamily)
MNLSTLPQLWEHAVSWLSSHAVVPALSALHVLELSGNPEEIAEAMLLGLVQLGIIALIFRPLESLIPAEKWPDRKATWVDIQYTLIILLGLLPLFTYLVLNPLIHYLGGGATATAETDSQPLINLSKLLPVLDGHPLLLFLVYYLIYDFVYYWMHRSQHLIPWFWALHSVHHSQRFVSCWTNDRDSYLAGLIEALILASVGLVIGVKPNEFALLMLLGELVQNFSHANVRISFGPVFEKVLVGPRYHRLHHMIVDPARPGLHNCNFSQAFPLWDILFGTALYHEPPHPTGVCDPMVDIDNQYGLLGQQWQAIKRFWGAVRRPAGWKPGDVAFGADYAPIPSQHLDLFAMAKSNQHIAAMKNSAS